MRCCWRSGGLDFGARLLATAEEGVEDRLLVTTRQEHHLDIDCPSTLVCCRTSKGVPMPWPSCLLYRCSGDRTSYEQTVCSPEYVREPAKCRLFIQTATDPALMK